MYPIDWFTVKDQFKKTKNWLFVFSVLFIGFCVFLIIFGSTTSSGINETLNLPERVGFYYLDESKSAYRFWYDMTNIILFVVFDVLLVITALLASVYIYRINKMIEFDVPTFWKYMYVAFAIVLIVMIVCLSLLIFYYGPNQSDSSISVPLRWLMSVNDSGETSYSISFWMVVIFGSVFLVGSIVVLGFSLYRK